MKRISISAPFLVVSILSFVVITLLPFSVSFLEFAGSEQYFYFYFNGRLKFTEVYQGEQTSVRFSAGEIWGNTFPLEIWLLIVIGLGLISVAALYKLISMDLEDARIAPVVTIIGGALGMVGTFMYLKFYNENIVPFYFQNQLLSGFYISAVLFGLFIVFGILLLIYALFFERKSKDDFDIIEEALKG